VDKRRELLIDIIVGLAIAGLVVLLVIFSVRAAPTFIYQAF
jgi:cytochrome c-type biogenesis protein CcmE